MLGEYRVTGEIVIARTPEEVFDFVSDPENDPRWCRLVPEVIFSGDRSTGLGPYTFIQILPRSRRVAGTGEIVASTRPSSFRSHSEFGVARLESTYELAPAGDGTRFTHTNHVRWKGAFRVLHPFLRSGTTRNVTIQLRDLKALLEAEGPRERPSDHG